MIKCDNCTNAADYTSAEPHVNPAHYCASCLPVWLRQKAAQGQLALQSPVVEELVAPVAPVKTSKKKTAPVAEPVVVEEEVLEETPATTVDESTNEGN